MSERYEIQEKIGQGGLGVVYRALDRQLNREVAIKRVLIDSGEPVEELTANLVQEAKTLSALNHPNIVTIHDVGEDNDGPFLVMELLDGQTLDDILEKGVLTIEDFESFAVQTTEALLAAQSVGLLHRDLKPANIMIVNLPSGKFQVKILDFGLAKFFTQPAVQTVDHKDSILGSIYFMAPEQFERLPLDNRSDLYSLGAISYYALAGSYPFSGESPVDVMLAHLHNTYTPLKEVRPEVPASICDWIEALISRKMEDRPADAAAALAAWNPEPVLNEDQLREASGNDPELAAALLEGFLEEASPLVDQLCLELDAADGDAARETARTLRGTSSTLGYSQVINLASKVEDLARTDPAEARILAEQFPAALARLEQAVPKLSWH